MNKNAIKNFAVSARIMLIQAVTQKAFEYEITENGKMTHHRQRSTGNL